MHRILIAEDEERIASFIRKGLEATGFSCLVAPDGHEALSLALTGAFDLMVLDIGLPGLDGFSVLSRLRAERSALPVIILTARDTPEDVVAGLSGGANDYMRKPFDFDELMARIRLRLSPATQPAVTTLRVGPLALDLRTRRATVNGRSLDLTTREFTLLEVFMQRPDDALTREQLLSRVWGFDFDPGSNVVDVYVGYLRNKLGGGLIETVRGVGYRLSNPEKDTVSLP